MVRSLLCRLFLELISRWHLRWSEGFSLIERLLRFLQAAELAEYHRSLVPDIGTGLGISLLIRFIGTQRLVQATECLVIPIQLAQVYSLVVPGISVLGILGEVAIVRGKCLLLAPQQAQHVPDVKRHEDFVGILACHLLIRRERLLIVLQLIVQNLAALFPGEDTFGIRCQSTLISGT